MYSVFNGDYVTPRSRQIAGTLMASLHIIALHRFQVCIPFISHHRNVQFYTVCISFNDSSQ